MEFTKADLRNWDIVVTRDGERYFVDNEKGMYRGVDTFTWMDNYDINLKSTYEPRNDIVKVYRDAGCYILSELDTEIIYDECIIYNRNEKWKPIAGERYYIPCINNTSGYDRHIWSNSDRFDKPYFDMNMVCKTQEDAINLTDKILNMLKNINND